ncbi:MAG: hypothetical protein ABIV11_10465 [Gemmatimonadaceae bacterium]
MLISGMSFLAGCTPGDEETRTEKASAAPNVVSLSATEYAFAAPDTIPAGWTTFRMANRGEEIHYGHIVQLEPGRTVREMVEAYAEAIRTSGPRPKWVRRFGGPGGADPGGSSNVTQYLEPGSYVWVCPIEDSAGHPHFAKGEFKPFVVRATDGVVTDRAAAPEADVAIRLTDYSFELDAPLTAGRHTVRVKNAGTDPRVYGHDLVVFKLAPGKTMEDVRRLLNPESARRPEQQGDQEESLASLVTTAGGIAAIAPGMEVFFDTNLTSGEYLLACMATAPDGRSHIEHGMIQQVTVR